MAYVLSPTTAGNPEPRRVRGGVDDHITHRNGQPVSAR
jgi:hypothetical protein